MENQPKKRGRKRKNEVRVVVSSAVNQFVVQEKTEPLNSNFPKYNTQNTNREENRLMRLSEVSRIKEKGLRIDKIIRKKETRNIIHSKLLKRRHKEYETRIKIEYENRLGIFNKMSTENYTHDNFYFWRNKITYEMAETIFHILESLLLTGPTSAIDRDLANECIHCIKCYYGEMIHYASKETKYEEYLANMFFPSRNSKIFEIILKENGIPTKEDVKNLIDRRAATNHDYAQE